METILGLSPLCGSRAGDRGERAHGVREGWAKSGTPIRRTHPCTALALDGPPWESWLQQ